MESLDQEVLDRLGRDMGGEAAVTRILSMYIAKLPAEMAGLHERTDSGDLPGLAEEAHRVKSSTAMLGATRLAGLLAELERAAKAEDVEGVLAELREIDLEAPKVTSEMSTRL